MPAEPSRSTPMLLPLIALSAAVLAALTLGALALTGWPTLHLGALAGGLVVVSLILPLWLSARILRALAARKPRPGVVTSTVLLSWSAALVGAPVGLAPTQLAEALRGHGDWWLLGREVPAIDAAITALAGTLAPAAGPAAPDLSESETEEAPPAPMSPVELFAARADSVVIVRGQGPVAPGLLAGLGVPTDLWAEQLGSGFVVSSDGLIVTNWHVVRDMKRARVELRDGRTLSPVVVVAKLPEHDLALLRVAATDLRPLALADREVAVGETAYAIGSPLGMEHSLTQGILSARREMEGSHVLQMQTPIAPGSSGGPLLDDRGQVIGVNTAVYGAGLGIAIEARHVRALLALPRAEAPLEAYVPGPRVASLEVRGVTLTPVGRQQLDQLGSAAASLLDACALTLPADAHVRAPLSAPLAALPTLLGGGPALESNLSEADQACARPAVALTTLAFTRALAEEGGAPETAGLTLRFDRLRAPAGDTRTPEERALVLELGAPPTAVAPASPASP